MSPQNTLDKWRAFHDEIAKLRAENERVTSFLAMATQAGDELRAEIERLETALGIYKHEADAQIEWQKTEIERLAASCEHEDARNNRLQAESAQLRAALKATFCPRPANAAPDWLTVGECIARDECGCDSGAGLGKPPGKPD